MSLLVIGTLAYDTIETAHELRADCLGGSAVFFAVAASLYGPVRMVGVVGQDFRAEHLALLARRGVDTSGIECAAGRTFRWSGRYEADWNTRHTLETQLNVFADFDPKVPAPMQGSEFVFLANAAPNVQMKALLQVRAPRFVVADTMNLWIETARPELLELLRRVDAIVLNDEEARMLTGERNLIRAAGKVLALGPRFVVLKKGEHGAFLLGEDVHFALPAYPVVTVQDPTGAGDSFAGGFMGFVASEARTDPATLRRAMLHGTITASYCVEGFSVEGLASRTAEEARERYEELLSIVQV